MKSMPDEVIQCRLLCSSAAEHLTQIYTGFGQLQRKGMVKLTFCRETNYQAGIMTRPMLKVVVNEAFLLIYDLADDGAIAQDELRACDFYFKRSYQQQQPQQFQDNAKLHPLGLNYPVYGSGDGALRRAYWSLLTDQSFTKKLFLLQFIRNNAWMARLLRTNGGRVNCAIAKFEDLPRYTETPRIIFYTRSWQPSNVSDRPALIEERHYINQTRAECIRRLRQEFGEAFYGGFEPGAYAQEHFPDCVVTDAHQTRKKRYLETLRAASIGIATMGLQGSNGWKLAEYVAGAKAILSEKLVYEVPGNFRPGQNYLEFTTPEECVAAAHKLLSDPVLLYQMQCCNYAYYQTHLRPDILIWNTLQTALLNSQQPASPQAPVSTISH
jgi:hypothetical protein